LDAAYGQFLTTLEYIAGKAGARVIAVNPSYFSQLLAYRDEFIFTDCSIHSYLDEKESLQINLAINFEARRTGTVSDDKQA